MALDKDTSDVRKIIQGALSEEDKAFANKVAREIAELGVYMSLGTPKEKKFAKEALSDLTLAMKTRLATAQVKTAKEGRNLFVGLVRSLVKIMLLGD
jgi:3-keto-L-gulonate-6-phosphate decarboxylase